MTTETFRFCTGFVLFFLFLAKNVGSNTWSPQNQKRLDQWLSTKHAEHSVAVFDMDNTLIKNDAGDAFLYYFLKNAEFRFDTRNEKAWQKTNPLLQEAAAKVLAEKCAQSKESCQEEVFYIYQNQKTQSGLPAFVESYNHHWIEPAYAWEIGLFMNYTESELALLADHMLKEFLTADMASKKNLGRASLAGFLRIYEPMRDLIEKLKEQKMAVWIVSASPQWVAEKVAERIGLPKKQVLGLQGIFVDEKLSPQLKGCGPVIDGGFEIMPYREGKRCWIRQGIFGIAGARALLDSLTAAERPILVAGDSSTDLEMLRYSQDLQIVLQRGKKDLACFAQKYQWLIEKPFLDSEFINFDPLETCIKACSNAFGEKTSCFE